MGEVRDLLEAYERNRRLEAKQQIQFNHELAGLIGCYMQRLFKDDIVIPQLWDSYPKLFEQERLQYEQEHQVEMLERAKASRREYAEHINALRRQRQSEG